MEIVMDHSVEIIDVTGENVDKAGFFCFMSKKKSPGYALKLAWLKERFSDGLRLKMLKLPERGFIEYIPGQFAWRAVNASGYMFIHCLWVVGKSKGKGFSRLLLKICEQDARDSGMNGVAVATSEGTWLVGKEVFLESGYTAVDTAPPTFTLLVKKFKDAPDPSFCGNWEQNQKAAGYGMTIFRTDQCPYIEDLTGIRITEAEKHKIPYKVLHLNSADEVRAKSPSAYGVFNSTLSGSLFSYCYLTESQAESRFKELSGG
jgi:hypothetical protein